MSKIESKKKFQKHDESQVDFHLAPVSAIKSENNLAEYRENHKFKIFNNKDNEIIESDLKNRNFQESITTDTISLYFRQISQYELLTKDQEISLATRRDEARQKAQEAKDKGDTKLFIYYQKQVHDIESQLVQANLRLVIPIAKKYSNGKNDFVDLIQEGNLGLMKGIEKYDVTKGFRISTYVTWWIKQSILRSILVKGRTIRLPIHVNEELRKYRRIKELLNVELGREATDQEIAESLGFDESRIAFLEHSGQDLLSLSYPVGDKGEELGDFVKTNFEFESSIFQQEQKDIINEVLSELTDREKLIIKLRYGINPEKREYTLAEVGSILKLSRERIRQIEDEALEKMKKSQKVHLLKELYDEL